MDSFEEPRRRGIGITCKDMACMECGAIRRVPRNRWDTFKYCSRKCLWHHHEKHNGVDKDCSVCGRRFSVIDFRSKTAKYCSRECYYKAIAKRGSVECTCVVCGKSFLRSPSKTLSGRACCSIACRGRLNRVKEPRTAFRNWMKTRDLIRSCNRCGYDVHPEILVIHHRDRDRYNNSSENLEVLCPNCHAIEHYLKSESNAA